MSKIIKDQNAKLKLIDAAREEFFSKGYEKASLRTMCNNAGLTTGALYFFFKDKKDLFNYIVNPWITEINDLIAEHYANEQNAIKDAPMELPTNHDDDIEISIAILRTMYKYRQECLLFINTPEVSSEVIDSIIAFTERNYSLFFELMTGTNEFDHYIVHWMSHMQIDAFIHLFLHEEDEEQAISKVPELINFMIGGCYSIIEKIKKENNH